MNTAYPNPSNILPLEFKIKRQADILFTITVDDATPTVTGWTWQLFVKKYKGARTNIINLTLGYGLSYEIYSDTILRAHFTSDQTDIEEAEYYWELVRTDIEKTWAEGKAIFTYDKKNNLTGTSSVSINVDSVGTPVTLAVTSERTINVNGLTQAEADALYVGLTGNETIAGVKTFSSDPIVPDEAYGASWDGSLEVPTKNALYDKIETIGSGSDNIYYTSDTCVNDADLSLASTSFGTDNTAALQAIFDNATATNPIIVYWEGAYSLTGIDIKGPTTIIALNKYCGGILRNSSNRPLITNENWYRGFDSRYDSYIKILGGTWNGNGYNPAAGGNDVFDTANGGSAVNGSAQKRRDVSGTYGVDILYGLTTVFTFCGMDEVYLENCDVIAGRTFHEFYINVGRIVRRDITIDAGAANAARDNINYDGVHVTGPNEYYYESNCTLRNGTDDGVAITANDATAGTLGYAYSQVTNVLKGDIGNVVIRDLRPNPWAYGVFRIASTINSIGDVLISNVYGATLQHLLDVRVGGTAQDAGAGNIGHVTLENISVTVTGASTIGAYINLTYLMKSLTVRNLRRTDHTLNIPLFKTSANFNCNFVYLEITEAISSETCVSPTFLHTAGTINRMVISFVGYKPSNYNQIAKQVLAITGGTINELILENVSVDYIANIVTHTGGTLRKVIVKSLSTRGCGLDGAIKTSVGVRSISVANYDGLALTSGTFTTQKGYAFQELTSDGIPIVYDSFNRSNGTLNGASPDIFVASSGAWSFVESPTGTLGVVSNQLKLTTAASTYCKAVIQATRNVRVRTTLITPGTLAEIVVCYTDSSNQIRIDMITGAVTQRLAASNTTPFAGSGTSIANDVMTVEVNGTTITVYRNGSSIGTGTISASLTGTKVGLFMFQDATSVLDEFIVY